MMDRSTLRIAIIVLTLITAGIHLFLGITGVMGGEGGLYYAFIANGIGYLVLLAALFMDVPFFRENRVLAHYLLIAFAAITLIGFFAMNASDLAHAFGPAAIIAKLAEVLLIIATFLHLRTPGGTQGAGI
jgi:hypothetical protein